LGAVLPALASWRQRERADSVLASWRYRITWTPAPPGTGRLAGTWLIVVPDGLAGGEIAQGCARALAGAGARAAVLRVACGQLDRDALAGQVTAFGGGEGVAGVVSLLALDQVPVPGSPVVARGL